VGTARKYAADADVGNCVDDGIGDGVGDGVGAGINGGVHLGIGAARDDVLCCVVM